MKNLIDVLVGNVVCHAQQICLHEMRLISALEGLDGAKAPFNYWLSAYMDLEQKKNTVLSCADRVCQPEKTLAYLENAQAIIAGKLVTARKNKHQALLFFLLCRHSAIVRRAEVNFRTRRRGKSYRVVSDEPSEVTVLKA